MLVETVRKGSVCRKMGKLQLHRCGEVVEYGYIGKENVYSMCRCPFIMLKEIRNDCYDVIESYMYFDDL